MSSNLPAFWLAPVTAAFALQVAAQTAPLPSGGVAPSAAAAASSAAGLAGPAMPALFRSALKDYVPFTDEKLLSWTDANAAVGRVGGWRAYAKEAQQPDASDGMRPTPALPSTGTGPAEAAKP